MHYFPNFIFGLALYMFGAVLLPIIRSSTTVHSALVHVIQVLKKAFKQSRDGNPSNLEMATTVSTATSKHIYQNTRHHISEDSKTPYFALFTVQN
jgi:hypothetical protein